MAEAKCMRCDATATADTFEQARKLLNHAIGLGRGINCGDNYNRVVEVKPKKSTTKSTEPQTEDTNLEIEAPVTEKTVKEKKTKKSKT